jgi:hypothetical protein
MKSYLLRLEITPWYNYVKDFSRSPILLILLILKIFTLIFVLLSIKNIFTKFYSFFIVYAEQSNSALIKASCLLTALLAFFIYETVDDYWSVDIQCINLYVLVF